MCCLQHPVMPVLFTMTGTGQFPGQVHPFGPGVMVLSLGIRRRGRENRKYFFCLRFARWHWAAWRRHNVFLVNEEVSGVGNSQISKSQIFNTVKNSSGFLLNIKYNYITIFNDNKYIYKESLK